MGAESVPRRELVTGRPPAEDHAVPRPPAVPEPRPDAPETDATVSLLMHRQMRAALLATTLLAVPIGLLPLLLRLLPSATGAPHVPLAVWLLLGVAPYPALLAIGAWYVRRAERNETEPAGPSPVESP
ncbi:hypothetical protein [Streptomyces broussonetiae]|uniref:hypothetical protein n=1 Tax=Streptomyces broussonetiae TaxID=2686304 RepID=UPI0035DD5873